MEKKIKHQIAAGFVIFRRTQDGIKFLFLYRRGSYWNFPKGHFKEGEMGIETALRETQEETGLKKSDLRIIPGFRSYEKFHFRHNEQIIHDTVILYLAETKNPRVIISPREHSGFAWFLYKDAIRALGNKYSATRKVLRLASDFLRQSGRRRQKITIK